MTVAGRGQATSRAFMARLVMALSSARAKGAFIVVAEDYTAFASAILSKLLLEIAGETPPARTLAAAALR